MNASVSATGSSRRRLMRRSGVSAPLFSASKNWSLCQPEEFFGWLKIEAAVFENAGTGLHNTVAVLRKREVPWAVIGQALGISRQAAWDRFS